VDQREEVLAGGNVSTEVVRVGDTVRKPATEATSGIEAFLDHLRHVGFTAAPRSLGRDERGRHVLEFIPGATVDMSIPLSTRELRRIGLIVRQLHTASQSFKPPASAKWNVAIEPDSKVLICHHDLAPWNLVRDGERWVFIDWDGSAPGSPLWDLAYATQTFVPLVRGGEPANDAARLRSLVDAYGLDSADREKFPEKIFERTQAMHDLLVRGAHSGQQPWARLHAEGHADHWGQAANYIERNLAVWRLGLID
jgi:Ser/Thr protein kinase RdoA (MazF antagonist)